MREKPLRDLLQTPPADLPPDVDAERNRWRRVREIVADACALAPDARQHRLEQLRASSDPLDQRAAELINLGDAAAGFLDSPPAPVPDPPGSPPVYQPGDRIGPYEIVELLGEGGMGQVYLADDTRLLRQVAVKVVRDDAASTSLLREARMAARLHHDAIVGLYDVLEAHGRLHIVMERVEGETLAAQMQDRRMSPAEAAGHIHQILDAVRHAHAAGVLHCDLKPANVFVLPNGRVKVLDFGLARIDAPSTYTQSIGLAGTPRFLAPERLLGSPPSQRTDIYSIGVILFDLLRDPADSPTSVHLGTDLGRGALHAALLAIAARAMDPDPEKRYASAAEMQAALDRVTDTPASRQRAPRRVGARLAGAIAALVVTIAAAGWYLVSPGGDQRRPVIAVEMSPVGADALAGYVAAALEQLVRQSLMGAPNLVVVRPAGPEAATLSEAGATHLLVATVQRTSNDVELALSLRTVEDELLASGRAQATLSDPQALATVVMNSTDDVLRRAGLRIERPAVNVDDIRRTLSVDRQAFEEYAQGREYLNARDIAGSTDHAIGLLTRAIERDPSFALAHATLAEAYWQKYGTTSDPVWTDRARVSALDALRLKPDDPTVRYTLALIYRGMGRLDQALSEVSQAIALQPTSDDMYRLRGRLHADLGNIDQALDDLATAIDLRAGYWENHWTMARVLFDRARYEEAVQHFRRVTELRPSNASAFQGLGTALHAAGRLDEALAAYTKALGIAPNANTYSNVAKIHFDNGRYEEARTAYEESARIRSNEPLTHRNLGDTYMKLGETARARKAYEMAISLSDSQLAVNPTNLDALSLQAVCYAKLGDRERAVELGSRVLGNDALPPATRYRTGVALLIAGDRERGVTAIVRAISEGYSKSEAQKDEDLKAVAGDARLQTALQGDS